MGDTVKININYVAMLNIAMINVKLRLSNMGSPVEIVMQLHDELVVKVPEDEVEKYSNIVNHMLKEEMDKLLGVHNG